jgi:hypothetical protein
MEKFVKSHRQVNLFLAFFSHMKPICAGGGPTEAKQYYSGYSSSVVSERKIE